MWIVHSSALATNESPSTPTTPAASPLLQTFTQRLNHPLHMTFTTVPSKVSFHKWKEQYHFLHSAVYGNNFDWKSVRPHVPGVDMKLKVVMDNRLENVFVVARVQLLNNNSKNNNATTTVTLSKLMEHFDWTSVSKIDRMSLTLLHVLLPEDNSSSSTPFTATTPFSLKPNIVNTFRLSVVMKKE